MKRGVWIAVVIAVAAAIGWFGPWRSKSKPIRYREAAVTRGAISSVVSATGTLNPVDQVEVGSQVSGTLAKVYVDYNDRVRQGQVLAQIEPSLFKAALSEAEAAIERAKAQLADGERGLRRAKELKTQGIVSDTDLETAQLTVDSRRADLRQAEASAERARVNMSNTTILAPISGTVIARNIDAGQTVAASLQAPNLFTLARDLTEMELEARVDEADIGQVEVGMPVSFTVDAFPDRVFEGHVRQIRAEPISEAGVVSYVVVSRVPNPDQKLLPGMTANVTIVSASRDDALKIPNAALRFRPREEQAARANGAAAAGMGAGGGASAGMARGGTAARAEGAGRAANRGGGADSAGRKGGAAGRAMGEEKPGRPAVIYVLADSNGMKLPKRLPVRVGITDGTSTELLPGPLEEGAMVVIGQEEAGAKRQTTNPFQPAGGMGGRRGGSATSGRTGGR
ncbi:MAG TPA: efflux RND transporter periplasmic adaptor subunit [Candidatus Eisenbacteria bacterium]|nr:efflux RND transporter periplasmic adaptor subunit [Candidatus Eisenbacteria bacterium]